jgi:hypothetical protein
MVGGTDVIFETAREGFDVRPILDAVLEIWPDGLFQSAEEEGVRRLTTVLADQAVGATREFFVYKDKASADSWDRDGWTEEHGNDMAHFLVVEDAARAEILRLTLVIGSATRETVHLIAAVFDALGRMSTGESGLWERSRRVDWEADLRAVGYTLGREQFYEKVEELSNTLFPDWTADELACHPHEALQFCEVVRRVVAPVPDHLVMKALMNRRRQGKKGTASLEPRLLWRA